MPLQLLLKFCERSSSREERLCIFEKNVNSVKETKVNQFSLKADGSHVDFLGFAAQYLEVYVCILVYLTYVSTFALIGESFLFLY